LQLAISQSDTSSCKWPARLHVACACGVVVCSFVICCTCLFVAHVWGIIGLHLPDILQARMPIPHRSRRGAADKPWSPSSSPFADLSPLVDSSPLAPAFSPFTSVSSSSFAVSSNASSRSASVASRTRSAGTPDSVATLSSALSSLASGSPVVLVSAEQIAAHHALRGVALRAAAARGAAGGGAVAGGGFAGGGPRPPRPSFGRPHSLRHPHRVVCDYTTSAPSYTPVDSSAAPTPRSIKSSISKVSVNSRQPTPRASSSRSGFGSPVSSPRHNVIGSAASSPRYDGFASPK